MSGNDRKHVADAPVGHRNTGSHGYGDGRGHAWHDLIGNSGTLQCLALLAAAAKDKWIAPLETDHSLPLLCFSQEKRRDFILSHGVVTCPLAGVELFTVRTAQGEQGLVGKVVVDDDVAVFKKVPGTLGGIVRISRSRSGEIHKRVSLHLTGQIFQLLFPVFQRKLCHNNGGLPIKCGNSHSLGISPLRMYADRVMAVRTKLFHEFPLQVKENMGLGMVNLTKQLLCLGTPQGLAGNNPLASRGHELRRLKFSYRQIIQWNPQSIYPGSGQQDGIIFAILKLLDSRRNIAPEKSHFAVWVKDMGHGLPPWASGTNDTGFKIGVRTADQQVRRVLPLRDCGNTERSTRCRWEILGTMDRKVNFPALHGTLQFPDKQSFSTGIRKWAVLNSVSGGPDNDRLYRELRVHSLKFFRYQCCLTERQRTPPGSRPKRFHRSSSNFRRSMDALFF